MTAQLRTLTYARRYALFTLVGKSPARTISMRPTSPFKQ